MKENAEGESQAEYIESVQMNIDYLTKCIEDTQNMIMQLEDDNINTDQLFNTLDADEMMYIKNKLANMVVNYGIMASSTEEELKDKKARLSTVLNENIYSNHLLKFNLNSLVSKNIKQENYNLQQPNTSSTSYEKLENDSDLNLETNNTNFRPNPLFKCKEALDNLSGKNGELSKLVFSPMKLPRRSKRLLTKKFKFWTVQN